MKNVHFSTAVTVTWTYSSLWIFHKSHVQQAVASFKFPKDPEKKKKKSKLSSSFFFIFNIVILTDIHFEPYYPNDILKVNNKIKNILSKLLERY